MINAADFIKWCQIFKIPLNGGGGGGGITAQQVQQSSFNYQTATGVNDAFVVNLNPAVTSLTDGLLVTMSSGLLENDTPTPTLQVNALPAKQIVLWNGDLVDNDISPDSVYIFVYNADNDVFQLINPTISTANTSLVQSNFYSFFTDVGSPDDYSGTLIPVPDINWGAGFAVYMQTGVGNTNTGASTLTLNGDTQDILLANGNPLSAGMIVGNELHWFLYSADLVGWVLMNPVVSAPSPGFSYTEITATSATMSANNGYITNNSGLVTLTLPVSANLGDEIVVIGKGAGGWLIAQNSGQSIQIGNVASTTGVSGSIASSNPFDSLTLVCTTANTSWTIKGGSQSAGINII